MVTYFNKKDLVKFGEYLFSEARKKLLEENHQKGFNSLPLEDRLRQIHHSDIENFLQSIKKVD